MYDLIVIGAGSAGLNAGLYASRYKLKTIIISEVFGGTGIEAPLIENWLGVKKEIGSELMKTFTDHARSSGAELEQGTVEKVEATKQGFKVSAIGKTYESKAIIFATGMKHKKLDITEKYVGKGVSYCVTCDSFFFKGKTVGVVGGSDCAATSALALSDIAKEVYIFYRGEKLRCEDINSKRLESKKNVKFFYNAIPKEIKGEEKVEALVIEKKGKKEEIKIDGIFIEIGSTPLIDFFKKLELKLDEENHIVVDETMNTSVHGIFAAGDITNSKLKQVVVAAGQGAIAAKSAYEFISRKN